MAALAIDSILHGALDEAAAQFAVARRLAAAAPADRRRVFDVYLAVIEGELARRRNDLPEAQEALRALEAALGAMADANEPPVSPDYWALALMNLGIAELWAGHPDDARQHLEDALNHTRRISRPFIEVGCLAHLAIAAPLTGQPLPLALDLSERALAIAEEHGWTNQSMTTGAFAMAGMALVRMGRFAEAERHLTRAEESLRTAADRGTEVVLQHARGMLRFGEGRFDEALAEFARAQSLERLLASEHVFTVDVHGRALQVRVRMGDTESAQLEIARLSAEQRNGAGSPHRARGAGARTRTARKGRSRRWRPYSTVLRRRCTSAGRAPRRYLLDATASDRLGDRRAAEEALEATLELAEPDGLILPFMLWPSRELIERHPKHRTAHATFISTILDTLAGRAAPPRGPAAPLRDAAERRGAAPPQVLAEQPDRLGNCVRTGRFRKHRAHSHAPHLREARCALPQRGRRSSTRARDGRTWNGARLSLPLRRRPRQFKLELDPIAFGPQLAPHANLVGHRDLSPAAAGVQLERPARGKCVRYVDQPLSGLSA